MSQPVLVLILNPHLDVEVFIIIIVASGAILTFWVIQAPVTSFWWRVGIFILGRFWSSLIQPSLQITSTNLQTSLGIIFARELESLHPYSLTMTLVSANGRPKHRNMRVMSSLVYNDSWFLQSATLIHKIAVHACFLPSPNDKLGPLGLGLADLPFPPSLIVHIWHWTNGCYFLHHF